MQWREDRRRQEGRGASPLSADFWRAPAGPPPPAGDALAWAAVWLVAGIFLWFWLPLPPSWAITLWPALLSLALWWRWRRPGLIAVALVFCGLALMDARIRWQQTPLLPANVGWVRMAGMVERVRLHHPRRMRMIIRVQAIGGVRRRYWPRRVRLTVFMGGGRPGQDVELPLPGDEVRLRARLLRLPRPAEPGAHDPALDLYMAGIGATGFARLKDIRIITRDCGACGPRLLLTRRMERLRRFIAREVRAQMTDACAAALALALMIGERGALPRRAHENLRAAGLAHILAISGLHLGLVAGAVFWLLRALLALFPALALNWPIRKVAAAVALAVALAYLLLSGNSVATRRAFIMLAVALLAMRVDRPAISMRNLAIAALAILAAAPHKAASAGFQMSFMAVMGLVAAYEYLAWRRARGMMEDGGRRERKARAWRWPLLAVGGLMLTTLIASLCTALPAAWHFNRLAVWGLLGNLAALPLLTVVVMPAGLLALLLMPFGLATLPLAVMERGLAGMLRAADAIAALPHPWWPVPALSAMATALIAGGLVWLCLRADRLRLLGMVPVLAGLLSPFAPRPDVLVEDRARLLAARISAGQRLAAAPPGRAGDFALRIWLRRDGDTASPRQARHRPGWKCDALACRARTKADVRLLYLRDVFRERRKGPEVNREHELASLAERMAGLCETADVIVAAFPLRGMCAHAPARVVIDRFDVWRDGAHALFIDGDGGIRVRTVRQSLPRRPWAASPLPRYRVMARERTATGKRR